jgi:hypothetical protein
MAQAPPLRARRGNRALSAGDLSDGLRAGGTPAPRRQWPFRNEESKEKAVCRHGQTAFALPRPGSPTAEGVVPPAPLVARNRRASRARSAGSLPTLLGRCRTGARGRWTRTGRCGTGCRGAARRRSSHAPTWRCSHGAPRARSGRSGSRRVRGSPVAGPLLGGPSEEHPDADPQHDEGRQHSQQHLSLLRGCRLALSRGGRLDGGPGRLPGHRHGDLRQGSAGGKRLYATRGGTFQRGHTTEAGSACSLVGRAAPCACGQRSSPDTCRRTGVFACYLIIPQPFAAGQTLPVSV